MSTLSSANVTDVNLVLKERTHMRLCVNMLIFTHNLGNWLISKDAAELKSQNERSWTEKFRHRDSLFFSNIKSKPGIWH